MRDHTMQPHHPTLATRDALRYRLSDLVGCDVTTSSGEAVGVLDDVAVRLRPRDYPLVIGIVAETDGRTALFGRSALAHYAGDHLALRRSAVGHVGYATAGDEVLLRRDVLGRRLPELTTTDLLCAHDVDLVLGADIWVLSGVYTAAPKWFGRHRGRAGGLRDWAAFAPVHCPGAWPRTRAAESAATHRALPPALLNGDVADHIARMAAADAAAAAFAVTNLVRP